MKRVISFGLAAILIFIFGFLSGSFWMTIHLTKSRFMEEVSVNEDDHAGFYPSDDSFWESKFFGGEWGDEKKMKPVPEGNGYLIGKFLYNGKPVSGLKFVMTLNSKYKTGHIITDDKGMFELQLPPGKWHINSIRCSKWNNKPDGYFILITGEEKLEGGFLEGFGKVGKEVEVTESKPGKEHISITINPRIKIDWPEENIPKQEATIKQSKISWQPYHGAKEYVVTIHRVTRESPTSTMYSPIIYKKALTNVLLLSDLKYVKAPGSKEEYSITIHALDSENKVLSESEQFVGTFVLTDGHVLMESSDLETLMGKETIEKLYKNEKMANAIETLIKEKMLKDAEMLLSKFEDETGRKDLLSGYLYATKGDCIKAKQYFEAAQEKGSECIPEGYRAACR